jgi:hypothetical protein
MNIRPMKTAPSGLSAVLRRDQRLPRVIDARRALQPRSRGRAWINGREVGGADHRFAHIERSYD